MNFLEKIDPEKYDKLHFLTKYDFDYNTTCGYGCCRGYNDVFYSTNGYVHRITVFKEDDTIKVTQHIEDSTGGFLSDSDKSIPYVSAMDEDILELINDLLPDDLK